MTWYVMDDYPTYERAREAFEWSFPERYNPATDCLGKHADPDDRLALVDAATDERYTYRELDEASGRLANALADRGIEPGDRVGVAAPQRPETPVAHAACWKLGAVTVPMTTLFGRDALAYRLADSGARAVVFDPTVRGDVAAASADADLAVAVALDARPWYVGERDPPETGEAFDCEVVDYETLVAGHSPAREPYDATPSTDTAIMYTSGSTGPPKGVRHGHALWLGRAAAAYNFFEGRLGAGAVCWTPADWAWGSALGGLLLGTWHYGGTVVAAPTKGFDPEAAFTLLEAYDVTEALAPPTALRMLMNEEPGAYDLSLRTVATAGEPLTPEILAWADENFADLSVNEYYGQTELNLVVANASRWFETKPGSMGKPLPGYEVAVLDPETRTELPAGEVGETAVTPADDRVVFSEFWNRPEATAEKRHGEWYLTGDLASRDEEGYLWFESRADDVIITSGYRVGPLEVERVLLDHPAVEQAGVVGVPDETRGEVIKAFVEATPDADPGDDLRADLRERARDRLAEYEYPREVEFVDALPKTSTGKIRRVELRERERDRDD
ncbi:AMP-dependent synthetase [Halobacteriales archaeon QS_4_69_31]|nr:MAG: AMP-dependent synthetase [Halobacteriales archaeon QS_4_69_31]